MKEVPVGNTGLVAFVDDEDYELVTKHKWRPLRTPTNVYAKCYRPNGRSGGTWSMHRLIMNVEDPLVRVEHIDRDGLNNQRSNLRVRRQGEKTGEDA